MDQSSLDKFREEVNYNLAVGALADFELPVTGNDGSCPVVVALEEEALSTVLGRLRAVGGFANLFVSGASRVRMASVIENSCAISDAGDDMTLDGQRPGPNATVGVFLDWVETRPEGVKISAGAIGQPACARDAIDVELTSV